MPINPASNKRKELHHRGLFLWPTKYAHVRGYLDNPHGNHLGRQPTDLMAAVKAATTMAPPLLWDVYLEDNLLHCTSDLKYKKTCVSLLMKIQYVFVLISF